MGEQLNNTDDKGFEIVTGTAAIEAFWDDIGRPPLTESNVVLDGRGGASLDGVDVSGTESLDEAIGQDINEGEA